LIAEPDPGSSGKIDPWMFLQNMLFKKIRTREKILEQPDYSEKFPEKFFEFFSLNRGKK